MKDSAVGMSWVTSIVGYTEQILVAAKDLMKGFLFLKWTWVIDNIRTVIPMSRPENIDECQSLYLTRSYFITFSLLP